MKILVDTNIPAAIANYHHDHHKVSRSAVTKLTGARNSLYIAPQVLYELWVYLTRSPGKQKNQGMGLSIEEAATVYQFAKRQFKPLNFNEHKVQSRWEELVTRFAVRDNPAHDAHLVAVMQECNVTHVLTNNVTDFTDYKGVIEIINPKDV